MPKTGKLPILTWCPSGDGRSSAAKRWRRASSEWRSKEKDGEQGKRRGEFVAGLLLRSSGMGSFLIPCETDCARQLGKGQWPRRATATDHRASCMEDSHIAGSYREGKRSGIHTRMAMNSPVAFASNLPSLL